MPDDAPDSTPSGSEPSDSAPSDSAPSGSDPGGSDPGGSDPRDDRPRRTPTYTAVQALRAMLNLPPDPSDEEPGDNEPDENQPGEDPNPQPWVVFQVCELESQDCASLGKTDDGGPRTAVCRGLSAVCHPPSAVVAR